MWDREGLIHNVMVCLERIVCLGGLTLHMFVGDEMIDDITVLPCLVLPAVI